MYQLSKREKFLLSVLAVLGLAVGMIVLLIKPALDKSLDYVAELQEAQTRQLEMQNILNQRERVEQMAADRRASLKEAAEKYYAPMSTEAVGETLVRMFDLYGISARSMTVSEREPKTIALYVRGKSGYTYSYLEDLRQAGELMDEAGDLDSDVGTSGKNGESEEEKESGNGGIGSVVGQISQALSGASAEQAYLDQMGGLTESLSYEEDADVSLVGQLLCSSVSGEGIGENGEIRAFLNSVEENNSMQMQEFSITSDEQTGKYLLNYTIDVYMLDQLPEES